MKGSLGLHDPEEKNLWAVFCMSQVAVIVPGCVMDRTLEWKLGHTGPSHKSVSNWMAPLENLWVSSGPQLSLL